MLNSKSLEELEFTLTSETNEEYKEIWEKTIVSKEGVNIKIKVKNPSDAKKHQENYYGISLDGKYTEYRLRKLSKTYMKLFEYLHLPFDNNYLKK
jgi:hypothetical protein